MVTGTGARAELAAAIEAIGLVDHHVHGATFVDLDDARFETLITESDRPGAPGTSPWDSQIGFAIRRWCAPLLDLQRHASSEDYLTRRRQLGSAEVNRRLLRDCGVQEWLIDTGFGTDQVLGVPAMEEATGVRCREVVRLEAIAESIAEAGVGAAEYAEAVARAVEDAVRSGAVGTKTVMAYRTGFDIDHRRPRAEEVAKAAGAWLTEVARTGGARLTDPTLIAHGVWTALDQHVPLQVHVGLGDTDLDLHRVDPLLLTPLFRASESIGTPIVLLHCWPFHRQAGYLAQMFPHVYFDVGLAINYVGAQSRQVVAESLEVAPFGKQLFSSDAWGPAELHLLGARLWRRAMAAVTADWVEDGDWSVADALRVARLIGAENGQRIYRLG
jgi:predicted TIM-barrel fold metal-dependent hydrolase